MPIQELPVLARYGAVEALALEGLTVQQSAMLERVVQDGSGHVLFNSDATEALVLLPLLSAGGLPAALATAQLDDIGRAVSDVLMSRATPPPPLTARGHRLVFGERSLIMGIVNVTPDSFSGDGVGSDVDAAVRLAAALVEAGADIVDVGGESTRPGSSAVSVEDELERVLPVVARLARELPVPLSIDTRKATVAQAALDAGAAMVNDVWGLRGDPDMASVVSAAGDAGVVLMHNSTTTEYRDVVADVCASLRSSLAIAADAGIAAEQTIIDPGFGFSKTPAQNLELVRRLGELGGLGRPVLVGPSRKSTIGALTGDTAERRVEGSIALAVLAVAAGAHLVRVHDVAETRRAVTVADAVSRGVPERVRSLPIPGRTG